MMISIRMLAYETRTEVRFTYLLQYHESSVKKKKESADRQITQARDISKAVANRFQKCPRNGDDPVSPTGRRGQTEDQGTAYKYTRAFIQIILGPDLRGMGCVVRACWMARNTPKYAIT